ncbi:MAG: alpha-ketoacid dehydrogenase subunit beta [Deltaproteobacteria bacterium]|jgi:pyruvate dehydrogenase E1 component beta subunit|nr:alpha-ketoacid dehydrogenase subunit beta [Deltaproteobacteria bacterium]
MREIKYAEALREALFEEMRRDERVFVYGEDVELGYAFTVCKGLIDEFGRERVFDTPICEQTIIGVAVGASMMGMRPVPEIQFCDLITMCMDQIVNEAAKLRYMSGGQVSFPMVIRSPAGLWGGFSAQHSQTFDAWFMHVPGLKVAVPATPYDAKGLLKTAIRDDSPVLFIERKLLYQIPGPVPEEEYTVPFGEAKTHREGGDVTIVAIGRMVSMALEACEVLEKEGINAAVIDPRTLVPLDKESIFESVKETNRAVIVEEGCKTGGVGGEIAALIAEEIFDYLDAPIRRVAAVDSPVPYNLNLEKLVFPDKDKIVEAVRGVMSY